MYVTLLVNMCSLHLEWRTCQDHLVLFIVFLLFENYKNRQQETSETHWIFPTFSKPLQNEYYWPLARAASALPCIYNSNYAWGGLFNSEQKVMCQSTVLAPPAYLIADSRKAKAEIEEVWWADTAALKTAWTAQSQTILSICWCFF